MPGSQFRVFLIQVMRGRNNSTLPDDRSSAEGEILFLVDLQAGEDGDDPAYCIKGKELVGILHAFAEIDSGDIDFISLTELA